MLELIKPTLDTLPSYRDALERGWSPDNTSDAAIARELDAIARDSAGFIALSEDLEAKGVPIILPEQGEALPPTCLGHIGYAVPPWKRGRGYASRGLAMLLMEVRAFPLKFVTITTALDNDISQKVIVANGGRLVERFLAEPTHGAGERLRWRIDL